MKKKENNDMQKTIRILAIIATALVALSLMLLVVSIPLQGVIAKEIFGYPSYVIEELPQFPLMFFLSNLLRVGCIGLLIICCGNKKGGIWLEILIMIILAIVLPVIDNVALRLYTVVLGRYGSEKIMINSLITQIANYCAYPSGLGHTLAYITCGMSIAFKTLSKK